MVASIVGNGLGLLDSQFTANNSGALGQGNEQIHVNIATGNLVVQRRDQILIGENNANNIVRTYNSLAKQNSFQQDYSGQLQSAGGGMPSLSDTHLLRSSADGFIAEFTQSSEDLNVYNSYAGDGAHDTIVHRNNEWLYSEASSQKSEVYDQAGQLVARLSNENTQRYLNDPSLRLTDQLSLLPAQRSDSVEASFYHYNPNGTLDYIEDSAGQKTVITYDLTDTDLITSISTSVRPLTNDGDNNPVYRNQSAVSYTYDGNQRLHQVIVDLTPEDNDIADENIYLTSYTYHGSSERIASIMQSDGTEVHFTYVVDQQGEYRVKTVRQGSPLNEEGEAQSVSITRYDYLDNLTTITKVTDSSYDPDSDTLLVSNEGVGIGDTTTVEYNSAGLIEAMTTPVDQYSGLPLQTRYEYDGEGNVSQLFRADGSTIDYVYDEKGNLVEQRDSTGREYHWHYNERNLLVSHTRIVDGEQLNEYTVYNVDGRIRFFIEADGSVTEHQYTENNEKIEVVTLQFTADRVDHSAFSSANVPDLAAMVAWAENSQAGLSQRTHLRFDFRGQLEQSVSFQSLDVDGNPLADSQTQTSSFVYDSRGNLLKVIEQQAATESRSAESFETLYSYDGLNRLVNKTNALNESVAIIYDDANQRIETHYESGLQTHKTYDDRGLLLETISIEAAPEQPASTINTTRHTYNSKGLLVETTDALGVVSQYVYDALDRQVGSVDAEGFYTEVIFDSNHHITRTIRHGAPIIVASLPTMTFQTNAEDGGARTIAPDRIEDDVYDARGNLRFSVDEVGKVTVARKTTIIV